MMPCAPEQPLRLRDRVSERLRVLTYARVPRDDGHELWWLLEQFGCGEVDCIERANGLDRKRTTHAAQHRALNVKNKAASPERPQSSEGGLFLFWRQATRHARPRNGSRGFRERKCRCHVPYPSRQCAQHGSVVLEQGRHECARFHVSNGLDRGRSGGPA